MSADTPTKKVDKYAAKKEEKALEEKKVKATHGKNILSARNKVNKNVEYTLSEAIALVKDTSFTKFDATVEFHATVRKQGLSATFAYPNSFGAAKKVVLANDSIVKELEAGKINFDVLLSTAEMMPKLVRFAKLLGPRGLMPNPKNGTLVKDESAVKKFSVDQRTVRTEKDSPTVHTPVGKVSMEVKALTENIDTLIKALGKKQFTKVYLSSTMGPSVRVKVA